MRLRSESVQGSSTLAARSTPFVRRRAAARPAASPLPAAHGRRCPGRRPAGPGPPAPRWRRTFQASSSTFMMASKGQGPFSFWVMTGVFSSFQRTHLMWYTDCPGKRSLEAARSCAPAAGLSASGCGAGPPGAASTASSASLLSSELLGQQECRLENDSSESRLRDSSPGGLAAPLLPEPAPAVPLSEPGAAPGLSGSVGPTLSAPRGGDASRGAAGAGGGDGLRRPPPSSAGPSRQPPPSPAAASPGRSRSAAPPPPLFSGPGGGGGCARLSMPGPAAARLLRALLAPQRPNLCRRIPRRHDSGAGSAPPGTRGRERGAAPGHGGARGGGAPKAGPGRPWAGPRGGRWREPRGLGGSEREGRAAPARGRKGRHEAGRPYPRPSWIAARATPGVWGGRTQEAAPPV